MINPLKNPQCVIERILEDGNDDEVRWVWKIFSKKEIIKALKTSRNLTKKSANFWALILRVPKKGVLCLNKKK